MSCRNSAYVHLFSGGIGGTVAAVATCPLEVVKTRLQSSNAVFQPLAVHSAVRQHGAGVIDSAGSCAIQLEVSRPSGIIGCMRHMVQTEGLTSLYKGLGPNLVGVAPARAIYFAVYAKSKRYISKNGIVAADSPLVHVCAGASAGFITHTCTAPIWFVKTRLQLDNSLSTKKLSAWRCVRSVYKHHGIRGFYRGLSASYFGISETIIHFVIYEQIKKLLRTVHAPKSTDNGTHHNLFTDFMVAAGISKSVASVIAYPHEVIRTRLRQDYVGDSRKYNTFLQSLRLVFIEEGRRGLYGGLATQLVRQVPNSAIMFMTYESIITFLCGEQDDTD